MANIIRNIIAIGRNQSELNSLGKKIKKLKVQYTSFNCDVNNYDKIKNFITKLKKIDIDNTYPEYILRNKDKYSDWII